MRGLHLLLITFFLLHFASLAQEGWYQQTSGTTENLWSVCFVDQNNGWTVGSAGVILHTIDGGENWIPQESGTNVRLSTVDFIDTNLGWAVGGGGTVLKTTNGGTNWLQQTTGTSVYISSGCFLDQDNGWIAGDRNILNTTDGGLNWTVQFSGDTTYEDYWVESVCFINQNNGWAAAFGHDLDSVWVGGFILKTTNGGMSWTEQRFDGGVFSSLYFVNENYGWVSGYSNLKTTDGGISWYQIAGPGDVSRSIFFINELTGWSVGEENGDEPNHIDYSTDGGENWESQLTMYSSGLVSVYFIDQYNGWVVGSNGTILHTTTGGVSSVEEKVFEGFPTKYNLAQNYPNPFNPSTKINYSIPQLSNVVIKIFDILGNEIETLVNQEKPAGTYELTWYAEGLQSGVYFYQLSTGSFIETKKMLLLK